ncbi:unnamed protein product [Oreochromis niloticus]|nr:unnamed protein product [Mustela putorius furo]
MIGRGVILLLLSGCVVVCALQSEQFHYVGQSLSWYEAFQYCRHTYTDLANIQGAANNSEAQQAASGGSVWIGLFRNMWKWSQTGLVQSSWFQKWATNEPGTGQCVVISQSGFWSTRDCSDQNHFICYSGATNDQILVQKSMNWSAAQSYCREKYTDLISINTVQDNTKITGLMLLNILNTQTAWIGLYKTSWEWSDGSNATYTNWKSGEPKDGKDCALMETSSASWSGEDCDKNHDFLCYQDVKPAESNMTYNMKYNVKYNVKVQLRGGSADLNDPTVQESILQQVRGHTVTQ